MYETEQQLRDLYHRFADEMNKVELPSTDELHGIIGNVNATKAPYSLTKKDNERFPIRKWHYAVAASLLLAIVSIAMLMRAGGMSPDNTKPIIAHKNPGGSRRISAPADSTSSKMVQTPVTTEETEASQPLLIVQQPTVNTPELGSKEEEGQHKSAQHPSQEPAPSQEPVPLLANGQSTEGDRISQDIADKATNDTADTASDTVTATPHYKEESLRDDSRRAMKATRRRQNQHINTKKILEEKSHDDKNIYRETHRQQTITYPR